MASKNSISFASAGKKRKLEDGGAESSTQKRARSGSDVPGLPLRSSGASKEEKNRRSSKDNNEVPNAGIISKINSKAKHHGLTSRELSYLTEEEKEHQRQRREIKKAKRQAKAAAAAVEKEQDPAKALAVKQSRKQFQSHDRPVWTLSAPTAGRLLDRDPVFVRTHTGPEYLVTSTETQVHLLSQDTSTIVKTFPAPEGSAVQCVASSQVEDGTVFIALSNGSVHKWEVDIDEAAQQIGSGLDEIKAMAELSAFGHDKNRLLYLIHSGEKHSIRLGDKLLFETSLQLDTLVVVEGGQYVVVAGGLGVVVGRNKTPAQDIPEFTWIEVPVQKLITCVDARLTPAIESDDGVKVHVAGLSLLCGYADGQIHYFEDVSELFDSRNNHGFSSAQTLHWHRHAVSSAKFSRDGNYIISGGRETVLVLWQLSTGNKSYLPHLTGAIFRIVVSTLGDRYALQMGDNSIMVLSTSELKPVAHLAGLQLATTSSEQGRSASSLASTRTAAVLHALDSDRMLLAVPASQVKSESDVVARSFLQTFDLRLSKHVARQALTRNNVTDFNTTPDGRPIQSPDVHLLQISRDGRWLATVDEWMPPSADLTYLTSDTGTLAEEQRQRREVYLKFWLWDAQQELWILVTRVDAPHKRCFGAQGAGQVFNLTADPSSNGFATIGEDGCVRMWRARLRVRNGMPAKGSNGEDLFEWTCRRTVELVTELSLTDRVIASPELLLSAEGHLAYSDDGSMMAAAMKNSNLAYEPIIHFIDTTTGKVSSRPNMAPGEVLDFGFLDRYFIVASRREVHVWDLITEALSAHSRIPGGNAIVKPRLSINRSGHTFGIAAGSHVSVYDVNLGRWVSNLSSATEVINVLPKGRGYIVLSTDASVRTLTPSTIANRQITLAATDEVEGIDARDDSPATLAAIELLPIERSGDSSDRKLGLALEDVDDDRPVVRPEQLATILDIGQSFALPPVKDMFGAVVGLFGRKPNVVQPVS